MHMVVKSKVTLTTSVWSCLRKEHQKNAFKQYQYLVELLRTVAANMANLCLARTDFESVMGILAL